MARRNSTCARLIQTGYTNTNSNTKYIGGTDQNHKYKYKYKTYNKLQGPQRDVPTFNLDVYASLKIVGLSCRCNRYKYKYKYRIYL
jgi:hypothetical protein